MKVCLVGSSGGHLTHLYMLKPFWRDEKRFWVTFDKEDARSLLKDEKMYQKLLIDLITGNKKSPVFIHHVDYVNSFRKYYNTDNYLDTEPNQIIVDYIASMTDDYFVDLFDFLFPKQRNIRYHSYFENIPL